MQRQGKWKKLYDSTRWRKIRLAHLRAEPWCRFCLERGVHTLAQVVDHIEPHDGNLNSFYLGRKQSLCHEHHNGLKQNIEISGFSSEVDEDGWPIDEKHPSYAGQSRSARHGSRAGTSDVSEQADEPDAESPGAALSRGIPQIG
jgi:hypothetical protein